MTRWAALLLLSFCFNSLMAQKSVTDSLRRNVDKHPSKDTVRAKAIIDYLRAGVNNRLEDFFILTNELIQLSKDIGYTPGLSKGYEFAVIHYTNISGYSKSIAYADSAFEILRNDTSTKAMHSKGCLFNNRGLALSEIGDNTKALDDYAAAVKIFEKINDPIVLSAYSNISELYANLNLEAKCLEYANLAIKKAMQLNDENTLCVTLLNYSTNLLMLYKTPEKAEEILNKTRPMVEKLENGYYTQLFTMNTGALSELKYDYLHALKMYSAALLLTRQNYDPFQECVVINKLTDCFNKMHDNKSEKKMLDTLLLRSSAYGFRYFKNEAYKKLAAWYRRSGQFKLSDRFMQQFVQLNDTIASEKTITKITSLEGKYRLEQKDGEIDQLKKVSLLQALSIKQKKWLNYFLSGSAVVLSFLVLLIYSNYKQKQKLQQQQITELVLEKKLSTTQAIIKGEERERTRIAKDLHDGLSGMLSGVKYSLQNMQGNLIMTPDNKQSFERSMDMLDNSIMEMRRVAQNMMPEALVQFGLDIALKDFALEINRTGIIKVIYESMGLAMVKVDPTTAITIYRIIQELVNNVIKHATARQVFVQLLMEENKLIINVDDNGTGFDKSTLQNNPGMGWKNIVTRVEYLKGKIDVKTAPGKGTAVNIELNLAA